MSIFTGRISNRVRAFFQGRSPEATAVAYPEIRDEPDVEALVLDMRKDYQAKIAIAFIQSNIRKVSVCVEPGDDNDPRAKQLSDHLTELWYSALRDLTESIEYGRSAFQKRWENDPRTGLTVVKSLEYLPPKINGNVFSQLLLDKKGRFDGIRIKSSSMSVDLAPEESFWFGLDATIAEPYGRSVYLGAPQEVRKDRKLIMDLRRTLWKKSVLRGGVAHVEPTVFDSVSGQPIDNFAATARNLEILNSGGWVIFPSKRDANGHLQNDFTSPPETLDPTPIESSLDGLDAEMCRSLGLHEKLLSEGSAVGALNAVVSHAAMALAMIEGFVEQKVRAFQKYVVEPHVARNYAAGDGPNLRMNYVSLTEGENSLLVEMVKSWLTNNTFSPLVLSGKIDVTQMLRSSGIPLEPGAAAGIQKAIEEAKDRQQKQAEARTAGPESSKEPGGASGFRQSGPRPQEQGGDGGNSDNKAPEDDEVPA